MLLHQLHLLGGDAGILVPVGIVKIRNHLSLLVPVHLNSCKERWKLDYSVNVLKCYQSMFALRNCLIHKNFSGTNIRCM